MISAKAAKELAHKSYETRICKNRKEINKLIKQMAKLGFTNFSVDVPPSKVEGTKKALEKLGYKVWVDPNAGYPYLDVQWS